MPEKSITTQLDPGHITLFLCGDVMTGRGIDQVLLHPSSPRLYEPWMDNALGYVQLAESISGPIPRPVPFAYIWGDALAELERAMAEVRIINLETAVTRRHEHLEKGINYRMHPDNIGCISAAKIDCCALANNHVLDWGEAGLHETLATLRTAKLKTAGAGRDRREAETPALIDVAHKGRVLVFAYGTQSSGIPPDWAATAERPGVAFLDDLSERTAQDIGRRVREHKRAGDIVVASLHWGGNWGYAIPREHRQFAHGLIDEAAVDVVYGHSSHHPRGIEIYRDRPILYGCGDFLNDYEGIRGYEEFRGDLALMYFLRIDPASGKLARFMLTPMQIKRFQSTRAQPNDAQWLSEVLNREGEPLGSRVTLEKDHRLTVHWT